MGKLKVTQNNNKKTTKGSSGIPNWVLSLVVSVVILAVLATCAFAMLGNSGIVMRSSKAMTSTNFEVNGNMMSYYYVTTVSNFTSNYSSMMQYFSLGEGASITDHKNLKFGGEDGKNSYDQILGSFSGTWFDYFMAQTQASVKEMLVFCEAAEAYGIELTDEDKKTIDASIDALILQFKLTNGGLTDSACLVAMYGQGVKKTDIRKAMQLSTLASKASDKMIADIEAGITDGTIDEEYAANVKDYNVADYFYYRFSVDYDTVAAEVIGKAKPTDAEIKEKEAEILAKYKEKIEETRELAEELKGKTDLADFQLYIFKYAAEQDYEQDYNSFISNNKLTEEQRATLKENFLKIAVEDVVAGKTEATDSVVKTGEGDDAVYTIFDIEIPSDLTGGMQKLQQELLDTLNDIKESYNVTKAGYTKDDKVSEWAFGSDVKVGDKKVIEDGDGADNADVKVKDEYFRTTVYFLTKEAYRDEDKARDIVYMMFSSTETAKKAIEALGKIEGLDKAKFEELANKTETGAVGYYEYEDCMEGLMQSTAFDEWLYDEETKVGSYTKTPVSMSDGSSMVAMYTAEGDICWRVTVKNALVSERTEAKQGEFTDRYGTSIDVSPWTLNRIGG